MYLLLSENLKSFKQQPGLKQATLSLIATVLMESEQKDKLNEVFLALDVDGDGKLSKDDMRYGFAEFCGEHVKETDLKKLFWRLDHNECRFIEYSEFIIGACDKTGMLGSESLQQAFSMLDTDNDGFVSAHDFRNVLPECDDTVERIISKVDFDGDGMISFGEFLSMIFKCGKVQTTSKEKEWLKVVHHDGDENDKGAVPLEELKEKKAEKEWKYKTAPQKPLGTAEFPMSPSKMPKQLVSELMGKIPRANMLVDTDDADDVVPGMTEEPDFEDSDNSEISDHYVDLPDNVMDELKQAQSNLGSTLRHATAEELERAQMNYKDVEIPFLDELKEAQTNLQDYLRYVTEEEKERPAIPDRPYIRELREAQASVLTEWREETYKYWI
jgi:Ca2+-binding EF-hand superfamily protein